MNLANNASAKAGEMTCIVCPRGCRLVVVRLSNGTPAVRGAACPRGGEYGLREAVNPTRVLTTTVRTRGSRRPRLPVRTAGELPLGRLLEAMRALDGVTAAAPVRCGEVVHRNLLGLGLDVVATEDLI